jgi:glycine cleavage system H protein
MDKKVIKEQDDHLFYRRNQFSTRLPKDRYYMSSHYWLAPEVDGIIRVGLTQFATRMLGDLVEHGFEIDKGASVSEGQIIGWLEGLKAASDIYCSLTGIFSESNMNLSDNIDLIRDKPYGEGWLYRVRGSLPPNSLGPMAYVEWLEKTIDRIQGQDQQ